MPFRVLRATLLRASKVSRSEPAATNASLRLTLLTHKKARHIPGKLSLLGRGSNFTECPSTLDHINREAPAGCFLIFLRHIMPGIAHGGDRLIQGHKVCAIAPDRHRRGIDRFHRSHGITLDTRHLNQTTDRITGQAQVVLDTDLGGVLHLGRCAAGGFGQSCCCHCTGGAPLHPGNRSRHLK